MAKSEFGEGEPIEALNFTFWENDDGELQANISIK